MTFFLSYLYFFSQGHGVPARLLCQANCGSLVEYLGGRPFARFCSLGPFFYLDFLLLRALGRLYLCQLLFFFNCHQHHHHNIDHHLDLDQPPDPLSLICHSIVEKTPKGKHWAARINRYLVIIIFPLVRPLDKSRGLADEKMFINWFHFPFQILSFELCPLSAKN